MTERVTFYEFVNLYGKRYRHASGNDGKNLLLRGSRGIMERMDILTIGVTGINYEFSE